MVIKLQFSMEWNREGKLNLSEATVKPGEKTGFLEFVPDIHLYFSLLKNKQMNLSKKFVRLV